MIVTKPIWRFWLACYLAIKPVAFIFLFGSIVGYSPLCADEIPLALPAVGDAALRILSPDILELSLVTTKSPPPARVTQWNFVAGNFQYLLPAATKFVVTADGLPVVVQSVGFRRRPLYAAFRKRDLRIGNYLYLKLVTPLVEGQSVHVSNPDGTLWTDPIDYSATFD
ncbi:MAG: hypothetical protein JWM99_2889, partial [Verrucomicrobiales bacterium]|nr:hypothetical protein [Verrucomicrobiales bacterium]